MADALQKAGIRYRAEQRRHARSWCPQATWRGRGWRSPRRASGPTGGSRATSCSTSPTWGMTESEMRSLERRALEGELARTLGTAAWRSSGPRCTSGCPRRVRCASSSGRPRRRSCSRSAGQPGAHARGGRRASPISSPTRPAALAATRSRCSTTTAGCSPRPNDGAVGGLTIAPAGDAALGRAVPREQRGADAGAPCSGSGRGAGAGHRPAQTSNRWTRTSRDLQSRRRRCCRTSSAARPPGPTAARAAARPWSTTPISTRGWSRRSSASVGSIERLTVAVLVDEKAIERVAGAGAASGAGLPRYEQMVRDAIGIDSARGDRLTRRSRCRSSRGRRRPRRRWQTGGEARSRCWSSRALQPAAGRAGRHRRALILALRVLKPRPASPAAPGGGGRGGGGARTGWPPAAARPRSCPRSGPGAELGRDRDSRTRCRRNRPSGRDGGVGGEGLAGGGCLMATATETRSR